MSREGEGNCKIIFQISLALRIYSNAWVYYSENYDSRKDCGVGRIGKI